MRPAQDMPSWDWICQFGRAPSGEPFDPSDVPWTRGVCAAFDDPGIRTIALQWAARMAKTTIGHLLLQYSADMRPCDMLLGLPTEQLLKSTIKRKLYNAFEKNAKLRDRLPARGRRSQYFVDLLDCIIKGAWPSESQLADYSAAISLASEVDKWAQAGDDEGEPLDQFLARSFEHPDRKNIIESTPQNRGRSRIETLRKSGTDSRLWVPCPHCGEFQKLMFGDGDRRNGGIVFGRDEGGRLDAEVAYHTAVYSCQHCQADITDSQRPAMIRAGVWADRGQIVDRDGQVVGPRRAVHVWSSQLSALYSLRIRWGDLADRFVRSVGRPEKKKAWVQLSLGETYAPDELMTDEDELAKQLGSRGKQPRGLVPEWAKMLSFSCDVQAATLLWKVVAIGPDDKNHVVDAGTATEWDELADILDRKYECADQGEPLQAAVAMLDSSDGNRTKEIYAFARKHSRPSRPVYACKGSSNDLGGKLYRETIIGITSRARSKTAAQFKGLRLILVATDYWEETLQGMLETGLSTACQPIVEDRDYLSDLLNATYAEKTDKRGRAVLLWQKRETDQPNDRRDAWRYALCGAQVLLDRRKGQWPPRKLVSPPAAPQPRLRPITTPDGRPFVASQR